MVRLLTAFTFEIDDPRLAADEIRKQLDTEHSLLKNSAGFFFCSLDFISSGAAAAVSKALPFETIGCTTNGIAVPGAMSEVMLAAVVITSDEIFFKTGVSDSFNTEGETRIRELYEGLAGSPESSPSLIFVCHSYPSCISGDRVVNILDRISGGTPVFGTNALDVTSERRMAMILHNGRAYSDRLALLTVCGGVLENRFTVKPLPALSYYSQPALATAARDNLLISINNMSAVEFMEKLGIVSDGQINAALYGFPLLVDNNDGTGLKSCAIHGIEEGGILRCGSAIAEGATLKLVNQMQAEVLHSSEQFIESIKKESGKKPHLVFSCFGRSAALVDMKDEMRLFQKNMEGISYAFIYSGGEFCPVYDKQGGIHNCFQQFSIISVSF
jgi:hypothetical protein